MTDNFTLQLIIMFMGFIICAMAFYFIVGMPMILQEQHCIEIFMDYETNATANMLKQHCITYPDSYKDMN